ncbi:MAG: hypothetical protein JXN60_04030, partial [Lentisphaerae bacterium]|nr:hypothetical protein [Lentisphaerota bacterium]
FRAVNGSARFTIRCPNESRSTLTLQCINLADKSEGPIDVEFFIGTALVLKRRFPSMKHYVSVILQVPERRQRGPVEVRIKTDGPAGTSLMLSWNRMLIIGISLSDNAAVRD